MNEFTRVAVIAIATIVVGVGAFIVTGSGWASLIGALVVLLLGKLLYSLRP